MRAAAEANGRARDRLLTLDAIERCQEAGFTVTAVVIMVDREEGGLARVQAAVPGVPCSALFTRSQLQQRLDEQRAGAR